MGPPRWISGSLSVKEGRDPLGLQTTTQDRLMPMLLPGILELSRRARYFSFHAFLLDRYRSLRLAADSSSLSTFIKAREWEYGLAVLNCPRDCGSSPVGMSSLRSVVNQDVSAYPRGLSVKTAFGGYGLYYRSPLAELGIVARAGTQLGERPTAIDVLRDTPRARRLAASFGNAVMDTEYTRTWMLTTDPIPVDVLAQYAEVACLCQLHERSDERDAVHDALFGQDEPIGEPSNFVQRRRSVAHFLSVIADRPRVVEDEGAYREALWSAATFRSQEHERVAGQWAGLIAKDVWQDALCSIWSEFCTAGFEATNASGIGIGWDRVRAIASGLAGGPPGLAGDEPTLDLVGRLSSRRVTLPGLGGPVCDAPLEEVREATERIDSAASGMIVILELHRRTSGRTDRGWLEATELSSAWQESLSDVMGRITEHLATGPTIEDTMWWIVQQYIFDVHERVAYSKLPDHTFRFRWEDGRVRFYANGLGRFPLAAVRHVPLTQITRDLALWDFDAPSDPANRRAALTDRGRQFVAESLS